MKGKPKAAAVAVDDEVERAPLRVGPAKTVFSRRPVELPLDESESEELATDAALERGDDETDELPKRMDVKLRDLALHVISILAFVADTGTDIAVSCEYFRSRETALFGALVLAFTFVPLVVVNAISVAWYLEDAAVAKREKFPGRPMKATRWRVGLSVCLLSSVVRHMDALGYGITFRQLKRTQQQPRGSATIDEVPRCRRKLLREIYHRMLEEERDATLLKLILSFTESAPQILLQIYLLGRTLWEGNQACSPHEWHLAASCLSYLHVCSILVGLLSLSWSLVAQHRAVRFARLDKRNECWLASFTHFLWRLFTLIARFTALSIFALRFAHFIWPVIALRYTLMAAFLVASLFSAGERLCEATSLDVVFRMIIAFVWAFTPLNTSEGRTRGRYGFYYTVDVVENVCLVVVACVATTAAAGGETNPVLFTAESSGVSIGLVLPVVVGSEALGLAVMAVYYTWCHPAMGRIGKAETRLVGEKNGQPIGVGPVENEQRKEPIGDDEAGKQPIGDGEGGKQPIEVGGVELRQL